MVSSSGKSTTVKAKEASTIADAMTAAAEKAKEIEAQEAGIHLLFCRRNQLW